MTETPRLVAFWSVGGTGDPCPGSAGPPGVGADEHAAANSSDETVSERKRTSISGTLLRSAATPYGGDSSVAGRRTHELVSRTNADATTHRADRMSRCSSWRDVCPDTENLQCERPPRPRNAGRPPGPGARGPTSSSAL